MGVSGAVVSAIASTILQYDRSGFLAVTAKSSAICIESEQVNFVLARTYLPI